MLNQETTRLTFDVPKEIAEAFMKLWKKGYSSKSALGRQILAEYFAKEMKQNEVG